MWQQRAFPSWMQQDIQQNKDLVIQPNIQEIMQYIIQRNNPINDAICILMGY